VLQHALLNVRTQPGTVLNDLDGLPHGTGSFRDSLFRSSWTERIGHWAVALHGDSDRHAAAFVTRLHQAVRFNDLLEGEGVSEDRFDRACFNEFTNLVHAGRVQNQRSVVD
jgi:hypothetical protein